MRQRAKVQEHRDLAARVSHDTQRLADEFVANAALIAVGRIGHDVPQARMFEQDSGGRDGAQEVRAPLPVPPVDEIRRDDVVAVGLELAADGAVAAGRLPDCAVELLDAEEGTHGFGRGWVEVMIGARHDAGAEVHDCTSSSA
jgi:hypothetical protein